MRKTYSSSACTCSADADAPVSPPTVVDFITYAAILKAELPQNVCKSTSLSAGQLDMWVKKNVGDPINNTPSGSAATIRVV